MAMNSTSSAGKPVVIVPSSKTDELDWIDWLRVNYPTDHTCQEVQESYLSQYGFIEAAKIPMGEFRQDIQSNGYREKAVGRHPTPDEIMHIVDINDKFKDEKHQIGMWRGDMADSRQYRFAFIDSDRRPIPVPPGVHIYGGTTS